MCTKGTFNVEGREVETVKLTLRDNPCFIKTHFPYSVDHLHMQLMRCLQRISCILNRAQRPPALHSN